MFNKIENKIDRNVLKNVFFFAIKYQKNKFLFSEIKLSQNF